MSLTKMTRRQAMISIATMSAAALTKPFSTYYAPVKDRMRFAVIGDWGTGDRDQIGIARQMYSSHQHSPYDFVISVGDNIYPNGSGRALFRKAL